MDIQKEVLNVASKQPAFKTSDVVAALHGNVSRQYVNSIIRGMVQKGILVKGGSTAGAIYALPQNAPELGSLTKLRFKKENLEEHRVFEDLRSKNAFIGSLPENVLSIFFYGFTEMLNNAIEHSQSKYIEIEVRDDRKNLVFVVNDFGIGVFKNVVRKRKLQSELEAIQDILKGKTTTQPHSHSGEGIFFTSKVADIFILESFGYRLRVDNTIPDIFIEEVKPQKKGTKVTFVISASSKKHLNDIFSQFVTRPGEPGFNKTEIKVRLFATGTIYISRSQARRVLSGLEKYEHVILDFDRVTTVGQAFADEIFRVFQKRYPDIKIEPINMVEPVKFMIDRAKNPSK